MATLEGEGHLTVDLLVSPVTMPARNLPISLRSKVKTELDRLLHLGVISRIDERTEWVNQIVVVERKDSDKVRLCIDLKPLNKALQREHHHLPTFEEILPDLSGAQVFTESYLRHGYWHIPLDRGTRKLTFLQTVFGRFIWNRLPLALKVSSEIFGKRVLAALPDLPGVLADDVLVIGEWREPQRCYSITQHSREQTARKMQVKWHRTKS